jgi:GMP synthase (glutamine-hydrolysing)
MLHRGSRPIFFVCQHDEDGHLGALKDALCDAECAWDIFKGIATSNCPRFDPAQHAGLIVLGGSGPSANARNAYNEEKRWIEEALDKDKPVLGICLGAQLLMHVHCRRNGEPEGVWRGHGQHNGEYGWTTVILTEDGKNDPVLGHLAPQAEMMMDHQDWCKLPEPPDGVTHLAYSETSQRFSSSEAFRIGRHAYGVQFHPELTREMPDHH